MDNIDDLLLQSSIKTDILVIALSLIEDLNYSKQDAVNALLSIIEKHDL
ncbi:hypothetical protein ACWE42_16015 [Sutcliffiella cohnii]